MAGACTWHLAVPFLVGKVCAGAGLAQRPARGARKRALNVLGPQKTGVWLGCGRQEG